jgi:hypothetical protein
LQRAFSRDRYILRALATRSQLDPSRRLTGNLTDATGWRRVVPNTPENRRTALLQDLLREIAELIRVRLKPDTTETKSVVRSGPIGALSGASVVSGLSRTNVLVLAEEAIRIDPASASLRQVATELQRAADAADPAVRSAALTAAATAAAAEARRAHADAPLPSDSVAPGLGGAFADAMRARLKASRSSEAPQGSRSNEAPQSSRSNEARR